MTFNGSDKSNSIIADIDFLLFGDGTTFNSEYSLTDRTRNINNAVDEAVSELFKADPMYKWDDTSNPDLPFATTDLLASQPSYSLPDSTLVIHRLRIKDVNGNYKTLTAKDRVEFSDDDLSATGESDSYFKIGGVVFPRPIPNYGFTDGVELEFQRGANHFTISDTTATPGFNSQFHRFLSVCAAIDYAIANGLNNKITVLTAVKEQIRGKILEHYQRRSPDARPSIKLKKRPLIHTGL